MVLPAGAAGGLYWLVEQDRNPTADSGRPGSWVTTMTSAEISDFAQVPIPAGASDVRWGYVEGFQDDTAVMAFRLSADAVDSFAAGLGGAQWKDAAPAPRNSALRDLRHIGAPDPSGVLTLRRGIFVSHQPGHTKRVESQVWLGSRTGIDPVQVWVYAMNVP
ncbi:hypothetical protein ACFVYP_07645 [Kitasatospora sp. NPDC058201]|uniref:hypothetical protein n=1 Tax=Kitasatospora sp. NPDC058201 TaxID=3346379 RepID=UPI0036DE2589